MENYFKYTGDYISGTNYWFRSMLQGFLTLFFGLGLYLQAVTAFTRAKSLKYNDTQCWLFALSVPVTVIIALLMNVLIHTPNAEPGVGILFLVVAMNIPHWILMFKNGTPPVKK